MNGVSHAQAPGKIIPTWIATYRGTRRRFVAILNSLFFVFLLTAPAQEPRTSVRDVVALTGRVELIDKFTRSLTLRTAEGSLHTIGVGLELELFDGLKSGDKVTVRVVESVIVELHPNAKPGVVTDTTA